MNKKWEYSVITIKTSSMISNETAKQLNIKGQDGWELVGVAPLKTHVSKISVNQRTITVICFLKREVK